MAPRERVARPAAAESRPRRLARLAGITVVALTAVVFMRHPASLGAREAEPTFADDVAPILYKNCVSCHRPGGLGPFSLTDYDSVRQNLPEMRVAVSTGQMPPWHAEGPRGVFRNDRRLSDTDKQTILRWIESGAKPGDLSSVAAKPEFPTSWAIGTPDAVIAMPEDFVVPASGTIEYMYFQAPTNFTEDKWVQAIECLPGAREVVHHVLVYATVPPAPGTAGPGAARPAGTAAARAVLARNPAHAIRERVTRHDTLHAPPRNLGALIGSTAPGTNVVEFAKGTALRIRAGTVLTFQMHYTAKGHEMHDRTKVGFRFAKEMPREEILATAFYNGALALPAGAKDIAVPAELGANEPIRVWGLLPHTHLRGTRWQYKLEKPDGTSEVILDVPHYDFNWQTYYLFDKPLEIPAGGKITSMAWYDNSASNKHNPDASSDVWWGDQTWDEMQYTGILYSVPSRPPRAAGTQP